MRRISCSVLYLAAILSTVASAQTAVDGMLRDSAGKAVTGATVVLQRAEGSIAQQATSDCCWDISCSPAVEAGAYTLKAEAPRLLPLPATTLCSAPVSRCRSRSSLQSRKTVAANESRSRAGYLTVDPEKTSSSYTFTQQDLDALPDPSDQHHE